MTWRCILRSPLGTPAKQCFYCVLEGVKILLALSAGYHDADIKARGGIERATQY